MANLKFKLESLNQLKKIKAEVIKQDEVKDGGRVLEREACDIDSKTQTLEDAAFGLNTVKPKAKDDAEQHSSAELIEIIEAKGKKCLDC